MHIENMLPAESLKALRDFYNENMGKKCVIFGAGNSGKKLKQIFYLMDISVDYFISNTSMEQGRTVGGSPVFPFERLLKDRDNTIVFVASAYHKEIERQLTENQFTLFYDCSELLFGTLSAVPGTSSIDVKIIPQFYKDKSLKKYFCPVPFEHLNLYDWGATLCCPQYINFLMCGRSTEDSIDDMWNSPIAQQIRASVLDGSYCFCDLDLCTYYTDGLLLRDHLNNPFHLDIIEKNLTFIKGGPKVLNIAIDPSCNLACKMCRTKKIDKWQEPFYAQMTDKIVQRQWDDVECIALAGDGEVFYSPHYRRILESISETNFPKLKRLCLYSNGVLFSPKVWDTYYLLFERYNIEVILSIDAYTEETYQKIRKNGVFSALKKNLDIISRKRKEQKITYLQLNFCVQNDNYVEMVDFAKWGKEQGADKVWFQLLRRGQPEDNIHEKKHPNHQHFLSILQDEIFREDWIDIEQIRMELNLW